VTPVLYHSPFACSTACRIAAAEAGTPVEIECVDLTTKRLQHGGSFYDVNPLGQVSALRLPGGEVLTENVAILLWIDAHGDARHRQASKQVDFQLVSWLGFCATELHKHLLWPLFRQAPSEIQSFARSLAPPKLAFVDEHLASRSFLVGEDFTAADAYLMWVLSMTRTGGIDLAPFRHLLEYYGRLKKRPATAAVLEDDRIMLARMGAPRL